MSKEKRDLKVDLTLLKRLVSELESSIAASELLKDKDKNDAIIELSKGAGLSAGIMQEATLLVGDFHQVMKMLQCGGPKESEGDFITKLMGSLKDPSGNTN